MSHPRSSIGEVDRFDGVAIPEEGRELVSRAARHMTLSPTTRFAMPLTLSEQRKVGIRGSVDAH